MTHLVALLTAALAIIFRTISDLVTLRLTDGADFDPLGDRRCFQKDNLFFV